VIITRENYFDHPAVSQSSLKDLDRSPLHFHAKHIARTAPQEDTPALVFGRDLHTAYLEPEKVQKRVIVKDWDERTKEGKARRAEVDASGIRIITQTEADTCKQIKAMVDALHRDPLVSKIYAARTHVEHPITWEDPTTGVPCKAKIDFAAKLNGRHAVCDLKSAEDASPDAFARSIAKYGYARQASQYTDGWSIYTGSPVDSFMFIVIEKAPPYAIGVYELDAEAIEKGAADRRRLLDLYASCVASGKWPGYAPQTISLPRWAL
jgi:hypothetical protein